MMASNKSTAQRLACICQQKGINRIVFSPGSRNAPLVIAFTALHGIKNYTVTDERSAAFIAMGIAQQTQMPVAIACTSGSAALNYAPAIVEAYYQRIPLLVLTADRPVDRIDQGVGQTMRQKNVYANYIHSSYELIEEASAKKDIEQNDDIINQAINDCLQYSRPVHINIPFQEPLYDQVGSLPDMLKITPAPAEQSQIDPKNIDTIARELASHKKILVLAGQAHPDRSNQHLIERINELPQVAVLTETCSNLDPSNKISCIDRCLMALKPKDKANLAPDLILTLGGAVISKKIKKWLENTGSRHWEIQSHGPGRDTFRCLQGVIHPEELFRALGKSADGETQSQISYKETWLGIQSTTQERHEAYIPHCPWSDLKAVDEIVKGLPEGTHLHQANSTSVRYTQLFVPKPSVTYWSNRGVSGIDGCSSTAVGHAIENKELHVLITGDLAFFYDSNALWNKYYPNNLKIIVLNNGGGDIFNIIDGPQKTEAREEFFVCRHDRSIVKLVESFGLQAIEVSSLSEFQNSWEQFIDINSHLHVMEINTKKVKNAQILEEYFMRIQSS